MSNPTSNERPMLLYEADRKGRWKKAREAYERWHVTGDPDSQQAKSWMAGYVSALTDDSSAPETSAQERLDSWYETEAKIRTALLEIVGEDVYLQAINKVGADAAKHNPRFAQETSERPYAVGPTNRNPWPPFTPLSTAYETGYSHGSEDAPCAHCEAPDLHEPLPEKASALPVNAQCSWGCHYVGDQFIRYAACTVHGASPVNGSAKP